MNAQKIQIVWKNRPAMIKRGVHMLEASWRNRCSNEDLARWYERYLPWYAIHRFGWNVKENRAAVQKKFWSDCAHILERDGR